MIVAPVEARKASGTQGTTNDSVQYHSADFAWVDLRAAAEEFLRKRSAGEDTGPFHFTPPLPSLADGGDAGSRKRNEELRSSFPSHTTPPPCPPGNPVLRPTTASKSPILEPWEAFHERHASARFFKPRKYLLSAFPELAGLPAGSRVLEVGCGSGSSIVPLLQALPHISACACDLSAKAIHLCRGSAATLLGPQEAKKRLCTFICNMAHQDPTCPHVSLADTPGCKISASASRMLSSSQGKGAESGAFGPSSDLSITSAHLHKGDAIFGGARRATDAAGLCGSVRHCSELPPLLADQTAHSQSPCADGNEAQLESTRTLDNLAAETSYLRKTCGDGYAAALLIFTLSACHPDDMETVLRRLQRNLRPGALLCFRDYGLYDMTMMRFRPQQQEGPRLFRREDGTLSFFFSKESAEELFSRCGFEVVELEYCCVRNVNRLKGKDMWRVWLNGKVKATPCSD